MQHNGNTTFGTYPLLHVALQSTLGRRAWASPSDSDIAQRTNMSDLMGWDGLTRMEKIHNLIGTISSWGPNHSRAYFVLAQWVGELEPIGLSKFGTASKGFTSGLHVCGGHPCFSLATQHVAQHTGPHSPGS